METIGLRELNRNPSKVVSRVRAGESIIVTDRGKPVLKMMPIAEPVGLLAKMVAEGRAHPPARKGMPDVIEDLLPEVESLADTVIADRDKERHR